MAAAVVGGQGGIPETGARAYDIKHYNYYLNSSRMAPGVAASSSSSLLLSSSLNRDSVFPLAPSPSLPLPPNVSSYSRVATRFLLSYTGRPSSTDPFAFSKSLYSCSARA